MATCIDTSMADYFNTLFQCHVETTLQQNKEFDCAGVDIKDADVFIIVNNILHAMANNKAVVYPENHLGRIIHKAIYMSFVDFNLYLTIEGDITMDIFTMALWMYRWSTKLSQSTSNILVHYVA